MLLINACRKTDVNPFQTKNKELESKFFASHISSDPHIQALNKFIRTKNENYNFIKEIIKRVGFPYWDKSISVSKTGFQHRGLTETQTLTYIPFVRDSQSYVNASLIIKTTSTDTTYQFLCDWQYSSFGYDTSNTNWNAFNAFHVFTRLDNAVFNRTKFRITDENLLTQEARNGLSGMGLAFDSATIIYMLKEPTISSGKSNLWTLVTWCDDYDICIRPTEYEWIKSSSTGSSSSPCSGGTVLTVSICTDTWQYIPSSGGGGGTGGTTGTGGNTGGGGSSGGFNPPDCEGGVPVNKSSLYQNPCEPGWISIYDTFEEQFQQWDNSIIIDPTVRPCTNTILNQIRNIESGEIAKMIFIMSGQVPQFDWEIREVPQLPSPYSNAQALTTYGLNGIQHAITQLNQTKLANATDVSLARTILHEAVHAFIYDYIFNNDQLPQAVKDQILTLPFAQKLKEFFKIKYTRPGQGNAFHNLMVKKFHDDIRDALKLVCPLLGISLTGTELNLFCSDMAWGGLNEDQSSTSAWLDPDIGLTDEDRARITKRLDIELNNLGNFSGTYGGYYLNIPQVGTKACP